MFCPEAVAAILWTISVEAAPHRSYWIRSLTEDVTRAVRTESFYVHHRNVLETTFITYVLHFFVHKNRDPHIPKFSEKLSCASAFSRLANEETASKKRCFGVSLANAVNNRFRPVYVTTKGVSTKFSSISWSFVHYVDSSTANIFEERFFLARWQLFYQDSLGSNLTRSVDLATLSKDSADARRSDRRRQADGIHSQRFCRVVRHEKSGSCSEALLKTEEQFTVNRTETQQKPFLCQPFDQTSFIEDAA